MNDTQSKIQRILDNFLKEINSLKKRRNELFAEAEKECTSQEIEKIRKKLQE